LARLGGVTLGFEKPMHRKNGWKMFLGNFAFFSSKEKPVSPLFWVEKRKNLHKKKTVFFFGY